MQRSTNRSGQAHQGSGRHHDAHDPDALVGYELSGLVRWLDVGLQRIVLRVDDGGTHGGAFVGSDQTIAMDASQVHGGALEDLVPGRLLRVKLRLPRELRRPLPDLLQARSAYVVG